VTTADGTLLYQHRTDESRVLVAPWVAAQMTDLLQGVVTHGTGRNAALGRPTAGKTGTTSSNKDGWFIGFSSGITTGVWMGRDDSRPVGGLQGGRAPAQAFHDFMIRAVANRPVENLVTNVDSPDIQQEPGNGLGDLAPFGEDAQPAPQPMPGDPAPPNGEPFEEPAQEPEPAPAPEPRQRERSLDKQWLDRALRRDPPPYRPPPPIREGDRDRERKARARRGGRHQARGKLSRPADPVERGALAFQPKPRRPRILAQKLRDQGVELAAVVHVDEMRDFVRRSRAPNEGRRQDEPPAVADRPG
jgi:penicillin-binding protein 1A